LIELYPARRNLSSESNLLICLFRNILNLIAAASGVMNLGSLNVSVASAVIMYEALRQRSGMR